MHNGIGGISEFGIGSFSCEGENECFGNIVLDSMSTSKAFQIIINEAPFAILHL